MKFVDWAKARGGDAMNEGGRQQLKEMTDEEKKPFWTRTYVTGTKEFRFDPNFIQDYVNKATNLVNDNTSAYYDYKKRELFPKVENQHE